MHTAIIKEKEMPDGLIILKGNSFSILDPFAPPI